MGGGVYAKLLPSVSHSLGDTWDHKFATSMIQEVLGECNLSWKAETAD